MNNGWIQLHRKFMEWEWYDDINTKVLFLHCLLKANHTDKNWRGIPIPRGSFLSSFGKLSDETGLSLQNVRTSINHLESTGELTRESTKHLTKLTVCKYDTYQSNEMTDNRQANIPTNKPLTDDQHTPNTRLTTTNNDNNINNENNIEEKRTRFDNSARKIFAKLDRMEEFANFTEWWTTLNQFTDKMRWEEEPYFDLAKKARGWIDIADTKKRKKSYSQTPEQSPHDQTINEWILSSKPNNNQVSAIRSILANTPLIAAEALYNAFKREKRNEAYPDLFKVVEKLKKTHKPMSEAERKQKEEFAEMQRRDREAGRI